MRPGETARGLRAPGVRRDGTFEVTATKTVAVPCERLFDGRLPAEGEAAAVKAMWRDRLTDLKSLLEA